MNSNFARGSVGGESGELVPPAAEQEAIREMVWRYAVRERR